MILGVVNVFIYYVMLCLDMKFVKMYVEKIVGYWVCKKVGIVVDVMVLVKEENC